MAGHALSRSYLKTLFCWFLLASAGLGSGFAAAFCPPQVLVGWDDWPPYMYLDEENSETGFDLELAALVVREMGCEPVFVRRVWKRVLSGIEEGRLHLTGGASRTYERQKYAYFTRPYRSEIVTLFVRAEDAASHASLRSLSDIQTADFRLSVTRNYYYGPTFESLAKKEEFSRHLHLVYEDPINLRLLFGERTDGFLGDPVFVRHQAGAETWSRLHPLFDVHSGTIHFMLSRKLPSTFLAEFEAALERIRAGNAFAGLLGKYHVALQPETEDR